MIKKEIKKTFYENIIETFEEKVFSIAKRHKKSLKRYYATPQDNMSYLCKLNYYFNKDSRIKEYREELGHLHFMTDFIFEDDKESADWYSKKHSIIRKELEEFYQIFFDDYMKVLNGETSEENLKLLPKHHVELIKTQEKNSFFEITKVVNSHFQDFFNSNLNADEEKVSA